MLTVDVSKSRSWQDFFDSEKQVNHYCLSIDYWKENQNQMYI